MIDREDALKNAETFLEGQAKNWNNKKVRVDRENAFSHEAFLVAPYNSIAYLDEGETNANLVGNLPIRVDLRSGECQFIDLMTMLDYRDLGLPI